MNKEMYFISEKNFDNKILKPRIPDNFFTKNGYEESKTSRVCFAPSIDKCLMGISENLKDKKFYVHIPIDIKDKYIKNPTKDEVPDSEITNEIWYLDDIKVKYIGEILVKKDSGKPGHKFTYGNKRAELYDWDWEWIEKKESLEESNNTIYENFTIKARDPKKFKDIFTDPNKDNIRRARIYFNIDKNNFDIPIYGEEKLDKIKIKETEKLLEKTNPNNIFMTSDTHFEYINDEKINEISHAINEKTNNDSIVLLLGDITDAETYEENKKIMKKFLDLLDCKNVALILGNNDTLKISDYEKLNLLSVSTYLETSKYYFSHIFDNQTKKINFAGHIHGGKEMFNTDPDNKFDVGWPGVEGICKHQIHSVSSAIKLIPKYVRRTSKADVMGISQYNVIDENFNITESENYNNFEIIQPSNLKNKKDKFYLKINNDNASEFFYERFNNKSILIYDVETKKQYRGKGYAYLLLFNGFKILEKEYPDYTLYLLVLKDNLAAINLYNKLNMINCGSWKEKNQDFYIMVNDDKNIDNISRYWGTRFTKNDSFLKYDPPYNEKEIKDNYGENIYKKLSKDPAHKWRMETGIELIHKEPTKEELERIWKNWNLMTDEQKRKSDKKSLELFGKTNKENYESLTESVISKNLSDFKNGTVFLMRSGYKSIKIDNILLNISRIKGEDISSIHYVNISDYNGLSSRIDKGYDILAYKEIKGNEIPSALIDIIEKHKKWDWKDIEKLNENISINEFIDPLSIIWGLGVSSIFAFNLYAAIKSIKARKDLRSNAEIKDNLTVKEALTTIAEKGSKEDIKLAKKYVHTLKKGVHQVTDSGSQYYGLHAFHFEQKKDENWLNSAKKLVEIYERVKNNKKINNLNKLVSENNFEKIKESYNSINEAIDFRSNRVLTNVKLIVDKIKKEVDKYKDNNNCQLCSLCFELQMRGINKLPRYVQSPYDIILDNDNFIAYKNKNKIYLGNNAKNNAIKIAQDAGSGSRFLVSNKWKGGGGGHIFNIINIDNNIYIIDSQSGEIIDAKKDDSFLVDVDSNKCYMIRTDNNELDEKLVKYNNKEYFKPLTRDDILKYAKDKDYLNDMLKYYGFEEIDKNLTESAKITDDKNIKSNYEKTDKGGKFTVSINNKEIARLKYRDYKLDYFDWVYIYDVFVNEKYRNKGIGSKLFKEATKKIQSLYKDKHLFLEVYPDNKKAIKIYSDNGFKKYKNVTNKKGESLLVMVNSNKDKDQLD